MTLAAGTRLGAYEVLSAIGAGGMGEVYRARDSRLDRQVAVKVLPAEVSGDAGRMRRFEKRAYDLFMQNLVKGTSHLSLGMEAVAAGFGTPMQPGDIALGEISWALLRGALYGVAFMIVMLAMGLIHSPLAVFDIGVVLLIGFAFAATGMAATTFMRSWQDFEYVTLCTLPMFLFSSTFYPLSVYPRPVAIFVEITPLYQGIALLRGLTLGPAGPALLWSAAYLAVMGLVGLVIAARRIGRLLLT